MNRSHSHFGHAVERSRAERDLTYKAIKSSMGPRKVPIDLEELGREDEQYALEPTTTQTYANDEYDEVDDDEMDDIEEKFNARDAREQPLLTPPLTSRSISPATNASPAIEFDGLSWPSIGTQDRLQERKNPEEAEARLAKLSGAVRTILECVGEDPEREGLTGTPLRYAKAMMFFTKGYEENLRDIINGAVFHEDHDELVMVKDIEVFSLCEHHLVPFTGKVSSLPSDHN
jgi:GTP cyclohydrolase IA